MVYVRKYNKTTPWKLYVPDGLTWVKRWNSILDTLRETVKLHLYAVAFIYTNDSVTVWSRDKATIWIKLDQFRSPTDEIR